MNRLRDVASQLVAHASTVKECETLENELKKLLAQLHAKKKTLEQQDKEAGLHYTGQDAFICDCGNCVQEDGAYVGTCETCEETFCVECIAECDVCSTSCCNHDNDDDDPCAVLCPGCETAMLCSDCCMECNHCKEKKFCEDCLQDTTAPFEDLVCPDCFDYIKHINM